MSTEKPSVDVLLKILNPNGSTATAIWLKGVSVPLQLQELEREIKRFGI